MTWHFITFPSVPAVNRERRYILNVNHHTNHRAGSLRLGVAALALPAFLVFGHLHAADPSAPLPVSTSSTSVLPELNRTPGSDWLSVRDFGAKGDGVTDDTASLQAALSKIDDGVVIYFPPGTYIIKEELRIQKLSPCGGEARLLGASLYGHGSGTVLKWAGEEGGTMLRESGMIHSIMSGFVFDGGNLADTGHCHDNMGMFETHIFCQYLAFRNFRKFGVLSENNKKDGLSTAEIAYLHSIFENCGTGISFTSFNDYDYTFDGCHFQDNSRIAVECTNGNFYIRNSRFENNRVDVIANAEHGSSIRRSVSVNSGIFLDSSGAVAPMTVERCFVANWSGKAAILSRGAPLTLFDNTFKHALSEAEPVRADPAQVILHGANQLTGPTSLSARDLPETVQVDLPPAPPVLSESSTFLPKTVTLPGRHFDAKRDFGAVGDGNTDDTTAIQQAIDAAKVYGKNARVYLPTGKYRTTRPLELSGGGYGLGGTGLQSKILFAGGAEENAINVRPDGDLAIENVSISRRGCTIRSDKSVTWKGGGADIRQYPSSRGSRVTYFSVYVFGKYCHGPFLLGLRLEDLAAHDTVHLQNIEGNIHAINSGAATIFAPISYEGTIWVKGLARGGCLGILTRLSTLSEFSLYLEDNQSLIASDFYIEQAADRTVTLRGDATHPPGRVTLSAPKLDLNNPGTETESPCVSIENYRGDVAFVATQFYPPTLPARIAIEGDQTVLQIVSSFSYAKSFELVPSGMKINLLATSGNDAFRSALPGFPEVRHAPAEAVNALLDLRALGELDWRLNYPELNK